MCWAEIISSGKDLTIAIAAATTAWVAWSGVSKWKEELKGKANFDTARSLMKSLYRVRDDIKNCRSHITQPSEFPIDYDFFGTKKRVPAEEGKAWHYIFTNRYTPVIKSFHEFEVFSLEAEVLWGGSVKEATKKLLAAINQVSANFTIFINNEYSGNQDFSQRPEQRDQVHEAIFSHDGSNDPISLQINSAIKEIEEVAKKHLSR